MNKPDTTPERCFPHQTPKRRLLGGLLLFAKLPEAMKRRKYGLFPFAFFSLITLMAVFSSPAWGDISAVTKGFNPTTIVAGTTSTLTISIQNSTPGNPSSINFTDTYPSGLTNTATPALTNTCGGTATGAANGNTLSLTNGSIRGNKSCTITINVTASTAGSYVNPGVSVNSSTNSFTSSPATLTVTPVSTTVSTVTASPTSILADGTTTSTVTVTLKDGAGNPVSGKAVTLTAGSGSSTISAASGPSNASGVVTFTVKDSVAEAVTYTAKDTTDNITLAQTATVTFTLVPKVVSINCSGSCSSPSAGSVSWTVTFNTSVSGVNGSNFTLVTSGLGGTPVITGVSGSGTTWTVTASTGTGNGTIGLNMSNSSGVTPTITNLPFIGQVYTALNYTCFNDSFDTNGPPGGNWVVTNVSGNFGNPTIVSNRLRLTDASNNVSTMAALQKLFPAAGNKIVVELDHFAYNGSSADGMCVVLSDASVAPVPGAFGGSMGYAPKQVSAGGDTTNVGFAGGWLGVALDEYGNFSNPSEGRTGGPGRLPESAAIRGSGSLYTGYAYLAGTATLTPPPTSGIDNPSSTTAAPGYRYRITIDHTDNLHAYTSVERDTTGTGNYTTLISPFDAKGATGQAAVPTNWYLSFTGSTGASTNIHEIDNLKVCSTQPQPLPTLDHVLILHDGQALTCAAENITLKACADATCSSLYLGSVTVTLAPTTGVTWSSNPITFTGGQTTVTLSKASAGTITLGGTVGGNAALCYNDATQSSSCSLTYTASSACFDAVETGRSASTPIYTKLAGTAFSLDVLALAAGFTGPVSVALVDPTATSGNCTDLNTGLTSESSAYSFTAGDNGRHTFNFNYPYGTKNVKVRIRNTATNPNQVTCSSDNFAIRPQKFTLSTTTPLNPASNKLSAGANFNLTATSEVTLGYTGTPTIDPTKIVDHNNIAINLDPQTLTPALTPTLTGVFDPATGKIATGTTFQYLDVGTITLNADSVFDATFASVDEVTGLVGGVDHGTGGDCIANSTSNTASVGFYGCNTGSTGLGPLGRFYPDHYEVTASQTAACNGFTYMSQPPLNQPTFGVSLAIQAMASTGATPLSRFTDGYASFLSTFKVTGENNVTVFDPLNNRLSPALPDFKWNAGTYSGSGTYSFNRAASPDGPYDNFKLKVTITDADGAQITKLNGAAAGGNSVLSSATMIRFGRLRLPNAFGPETAPVIMALRTEYYNGTGFATNTLDNCTSLNLATDLQLKTGGSWMAGNTAMSIGSGTTNATIANSPFVNGQAGLSFSAPGAGNVGFVDVQVPAATMSSFPWLQYDWNNDGSLDTTLNARANFGIYRGNDRIINWREITR